MIKNEEENVQKLERYLKEREKINIDIVELIKAIGIRNGVRVKKTKDINEVLEVLPSQKHTLFILLDGFGYYKLNTLPDSSILKKNLKKKIRTVNPTSTACVITSIISASYPNSHGIYGWWDYNKKYNLNYYPLLFSERKTGISLDEKKIPEKDIYVFESIFDKFKTKVNIFEPREIVNSTYSKLICKNAKRYGFYSIKDAFKSVKKRIIDSEHTSTFNYLYIDGLDLASHDYGVDSKEVTKIIEDVEDGIKFLLNEFHELNIILTADHGQIDMTKMMYLNQTIDFSKYFYAMPSIDTRTISFFVKEEYFGEFEENFMKEFGHDVILLTKEQVKNYKLFGKEEFSDIAYNSLGEYIAIVVNDKFMVCDKMILEDKYQTKGNHSGLTKQETTVPLIVI